MTTPMRIGAGDEPADNSEHFEVPGPAGETLLDPATVLADLADEMAKPVDAGYVTLAVPARPDFMLKFRTNIDYDSLRMWIRKAKDTKGDKDTPHMLRLAFAVLSNTNVGVIYRDVEVPANDGGPLTVAHPQFQALAKASIGNSVPAAIRKFYGFDGHIIQVMNKVLEEAGFSEVDLEGGGEDGPLTY